jgi:hypothetical protein
VAVKPSRVIEASDDGAEQVNAGHLTRRHHPRNRRMAGGSRDFDTSRRATSLIAVLLACPNVVLGLLLLAVGADSAVF